LDGAPSRDEESSEKEGESGPGEGEMLYKLRAIRSTSTSRTTSERWLKTRRLRLVQTRQIRQLFPQTMTSPFQERTFIPANPSNPGASATPRGRPRAAVSSTAKRGRKPRAGTLDSPLATSSDVLSNPSAAPSAATSPATATPILWTQPAATTPVAPTAAAAAAAPVTPSADAPVVGPSSATSAPTGAQRLIGAMEEEAEAEDELLPAMADDDYSAQLSWQSQSKDNLKCASHSVHFLGPP